MDQPGSGTQRTPEPRGSYLWMSDHSGPPIPLPTLAILNHANSMRCHCGLCRVATPGSLGPGAGYPPSFVHHDLIPLSSAPGVHSQNGKAERMGRHIYEVATALLEDARLPLLF